MKDNDDVLKVRMLGGFSMVWNGQTLMGGTHSDDTQLARLLQVLLHYGNKGVSRNELVRILDEDSKSDDINHLLRSVLYNIRRKFKELGFPESDFIEFREGRYYWTSDVKVWEDARAFEDLYTRAEEESDPLIRKKLYLEACFMYIGEFLPHQMRLPWVSDEEMRYSKIFKNCVEMAAEFLRAGEDYLALEELGRHASRVSPFSEWEALTMEALTAQGQYRRAQELYEKTVEMYQKEMGIKPSINLISKLDIHASILEYRSASAEEVYEKLSENVAGQREQFCSYPVFKGIYRMIRRAGNYISKDTFVMICTLTGTGENTRKSRLNNKKMAELSEKIINAICDSIKSDDLICRFTRDQFLVLLTDRTPEGCEVVRDRISHRCGQRGINVSLDFDIRPIEK